KLVTGVQTCALPISRCSPMPLSSHTIRHHEEDKRCRRARRKRYDTMHDEERIFVWPVLASYAWILVISDVQGEYWLLCMDFRMCTCRLVYMRIIRSVDKVVLLL